MGQGERHRSRNAAGAALQRCSALCMQAGRGIRRPGGLVLDWPHPLTMRRRLSTMACSSISSPRSRPASCSTGPAGGQPTAVLSLRASAPLDWSRSMSGRLQDRIAIVTGAGCIGLGWGNGCATAVRFAEDPDQRMHHSASLRRRVASGQVASADQASALRSRAGPAGRKMIMAMKRTPTEPNRGTGRRTDARHEFTQKLEEAGTDDRADQRADAAHHVEDHGVARGDEIQSRVAELVLNCVEHAGSSATIPNSITDTNFGNA